MIDLSKVRNFYVACGYTDLRYGIDGLAAVVTQQFGGYLDVNVNEKVSRALMNF